MKKLILTALTAFLGVMSIQAQEASVEEVTAEEVTAERDQTEINNRIWKRGRFFNLGYAISQTGDGVNPVEKNKYGVSLTKGTTYLFPKQPLANMVKIGFDVVWFDFQFSKYKSAFGSIDWTSEIDPIEDDYDYDDDNEYGQGLFDNLTQNIGHMSMTFGVGIGPNVTVAPFALTDIKIMQPLKASVYFHYLPTLGMYARASDGDIEMSTGFCNMMDFGFKLQYRAIGLGVEGHWGSGKFKPLDFESMLGGSDGLGTTRYKRQFASTRIYLSFNI